MGKNTEEIKARRELWKAYIDRGVEPENLNDDRSLYVSYFVSEIEETVIGENAKSIKDAARLVQEFVKKTDAYTIIIVKEGHEHVLRLSLIGGFWRFEYWV